MFNLLKNFFRKENKPAEKMIKVGGQKITQSDFVKHEKRFVSLIKKDGVDHKIEAYGLNSLMNNIQVKFNITFNFDIETYSDLKKYLYHFHNISISHTR